MRTYERLNVEVVKFEAQDVITASVAAPPVESIPSTGLTPACICNSFKRRSHGVARNGYHYGDVEGDGMGVRWCYATEETHETVCSRD